MGKDRRLSVRPNLRIKPKQSDKLDEHWVLLVQLKWTVRQVLLAKKRDAWMFLTRVEKGTTIVQIENYLKQKYVNSSFVIENLNSKSGYFDSFKVRAELSDIESLMDAAVWPEDTSTITGANAPGFAKKSILNLLYINTHSMARKIGELENLINE
ncbi:hypothetical protein HHI36_005154 [Cryptolaemus montrouzieri]|uniref:Uncharacterized protein n=1 Tax=Cryptolaemus montrouzieri TaxID=559131 RepID=A0ABD2NU91_9CUCU